MPIITRPTVMGICFISLLSLFFATALVINDLYNSPPFQVYIGIGMGIGAINESYFMYVKEERNKRRG